MLLASAIASAGVRKVIATSTGPKISTWAMVAEGATSVNSVGGKKSPSFGQAQEGCQSFAPSSTPCLTSRSMCSSWTGATMAPMSTALSSGSPTRRRSMRARSFSMTLSATDSCTRRRDPAQQTCPWLNQIASTAPSITLSMSESSKTRNGPFPPSSSERCLPLPAVERRMMRPTSVEPVKAILSTPGCSTIAAPAFPSPVTMLTTPAGSRAAWHSSAKACAVSEVNSAGLSTTVFPAASAGAIFQESMRRGKFQGMIWPTTPTGAWPGNSRSRSCAQPAWW